MPATRVGSRLAAVVVFAALVGWVALAPPAALAKHRATTGHTGAPAPARVALAAPAPDSAAVADSAAAADSSAALASAPVPAPRDSTVPAQDYLAKVRADFTPENRSYSGIKTALRFISPLYGILIALLVLFSGFSAALRDVAHAIGQRRYVRVLVFFTLYSIALFLLTLPLEWYDGFALEHQFGLSTQTFGGWIGDQLKAGVFALAVFGIVPILWLVYLVFAKSPRRWWLWLAAGTLPLLVAGTLLQPLAFDPLFNHFTPLRDQHLKGRILELAARADIPGRRVYEVDKSAQTRKYNAYVNGFGASQRIVLWDTILHGMSEDEILFVMGHEMGHYKLGHIWKGIALTVVLALGLFFFAARICDWALRRFGSRWGIPSMADVASLPLLLLVIDVLGLIGQPLVNGYSRRVESESDIYGLEITQNSDAAARAFVKLGSQNKSNPEPSTMVKWMLYTHPPDGERVRRAMTYHPWAEGKANEFFRAKP